MLSYTYPFITYSSLSSSIGCKPILIFYMVYFLASTGYIILHFINKNYISMRGTRKHSNKAWVYAAYWMLPLLYFFAPSTGETNSFAIGIAETYLQYESFLGGAMVAILVVAILSKATWQHICILDKAENLMILGTVVSTILARQINSAWIANLIWFVILGMMQITRWHLWVNFSPVFDSDKTASIFQPVKAYEELLPQQKKLAGRLTEIIRSHNIREPLAICVAGKWGAGKTSIVNGALDFLETDDPSCNYEVLHINTMELDTLSSLFNYVFGHLRNILKRRGAYVGIGSEYKQFIASAVGKITDNSVAALIESRLFPSTEDYRTQMKELERCISTALGQDKILIIVDDVERCDIEKAQQFIFFIKEIATVRNCITIFLTDYEYLNQRFNMNATSGVGNLNEKSSFFYEKFFNYRIDVPLLDYEESMVLLWQGLDGKAKELGFRQPHELFVIFRAKLRQGEQSYRDAAKSKEAKEEKEKLLIQADKLGQLFNIFSNNLLLPRMLVKYREVMRREYSILRSAYMQEGTLADDTSRFFSLIRFDEILFLLVYIEVCAPYHALHLREQGVLYLKYLPDEAEDMQQLLHKLSEDLLYSTKPTYNRTNEDYRCNEATRFVQAYLDNDLPKTVRGFSSRDEMWCNAIQENNKGIIRTYWTEMVQMVARNYGWQNPELGKQYLKLLFSFAQKEFLISQEGIDIIFTIFEKSQRNYEVFSAQIAIFKLFNEEMGNSLRVCSQKCIDLMEQFSVLYFWHRVGPICSAVNFMAPAEYSKTDDLQREMSDASEYMLSSDKPIDNLKKILNKICTAVPSITIPPNENIFQQFRFLANELERYLTEAELIQFDDMSDRLHLINVAIEDMECFISLLHKFKDGVIPTGSFSTTINLEDMDKTIQQFKDALKAPNASKDTSLQLNLETLFSTIRFSKTELSEQHYQELQSIVTSSERLYGPAAYHRKILADHRKKPTSSSLPNTNMQQH